MFVYVYNVIKHIFILILQCFSQLKWIFHFTYMSPRVLTMNETFRELNAVLQSRTDHVINLSQAKFDTCNSNKKHYQVRQMQKNYMRQ